MNVASVIFDGDNPQDDKLYLKPKTNLLTGEDDYKKKVIDNPSSLEIDLLTLASAIYACDLAFKRGEREKISRKIHLTVPVVNWAVFNNKQTIEDLVYALSILSHDAWQIEFLPRPGIPEANNDWHVKNRGNVLLFSGGLDSFAGAIRFLDSNNPLCLVSHVTANPIVKRTQNALKDYLMSSYPNIVEHIPIRVSGLDKSDKGFRFPSDNEREETQRTRSFLFLTLASLIARRKGYGLVRVLWTQLMS